MAAESFHAEAAPQTAGYLRQNSLADYTLRLGTLVTELDVAEGTETAERIEEEITGLRAENPDHHTKLTMEAAGAIGDTDYVPDEFDTAYDEFVERINQDKV